VGRPRPPLSTNSSCSRGLTACGTRCDHEQRAMRARKRPTTTPVPAPTAAAGLAHTPPPHNSSMDHNNRQPPLQQTDASARRLAVLERQCTAGPSTSSVVSSHAADGSGPSTSYATATGSPSSYARVHGAVSRAPAHWREIHAVAQQALEEVKYAKCDEGIAKVRRRRLHAISIIATLPHSTCCCW
jgi:hypothetical protein